MGVQHLHVSLVRGGVGNALLTTEKQKGTHPSIFSVPLCNFPLATIIQYLLFHGSLKSFHSPTSIGLVIA